MMINKLNIKRERYVSYYILDVAFKCNLFLFFLLFAFFFISFFSFFPYFLCLFIYVGLQECSNVIGLLCLGAFILDSSSLSELQLVQLVWLLREHLCNVQQTCEGRLSWAAWCGHLGE